MTLFAMRYGRMTRKQPDVKTIRFCCCFSSGLIPPNLVEIVPPNLLASCSTKATE